MGFDDVLWGRSSPRASTVILFGPSRATRLTLFPSRLGTITILYESLAALCRLHMSSSSSSGLVVSGLLNKLAGSSAICSWRRTRGLSKSALRLIVPTASREVGVLVRVFVQHLSPSLLYVEVLLRVRKPGIQRQSCGIDRVGRKECRLSGSLARVSAGTDPRR